MSKQSYTSYQKIMFNQILINFIDNSNIDKNKQCAVVLDGEELNTSIAFHNYNPHMYILITQREEDTLKLSKETRDLIGLRNNRICFDKRKLEEAYQDLCQNSSPQTPSKKSAFPLSVIENMFKNTENEYSAISKPDCFRSITPNIVYADFTGEYKTKVNRDTIGSILHCGAKHLIFGVTFSLKNRGRKSIIHSPFEDMDEYTNPDTRVACISRNLLNQIQAVYNIKRYFNVEYSQVEIFKNTYHGPMIFYAFELIKHENDIIYTPITETILEDYRKNNNMFFNKNGNDYTKLVQTYIKLYKNSFHKGKRFSDNSNCTDAKMADYLIKRHKLNIAHTTGLEYYNELINKKTMRDNDEGLNDSPILVKRVKKSPFIIYDSDDEIQSYKPTTIRLNNPPLGSRVPFTKFLKNARPIQLRYVEYKTREFLNAQGLSNYIINNKPYIPTYLSDIYITFLDNILDNRYDDILQFEKQRKSQNNIKHHV